MIKSKRRAPRNQQRTDCIAGVNFKPFLPCELGKSNVCCWGIDDEENLHCAYEFIRNNPAGATLQHVAEVLAVSRQRIEQIEKQALDKLATKLYRLAASSHRI